MILYRVLILLIGFASSLPLQAQWLDAKGRSAIINNNIDMARQLAVEDALKHALLFAGAEINSVTQLANGLLQSERFNVRATGTVRNIQLVSEERTQDSMTVHIRADIMANKSNCVTAKTVKTIALTKFPIRHRQQAVHGALFNLGDDVAQQLFNKMVNYRGNYQASTLLPIKQVLEINAQPFDRYGSSTSAQQLLSAQADSQYLLTSEIEDLSIATSKWFGLSTNELTRQYSASYSLFDGISGERVWHQRYVNQAPWSFAKTAQVDSASHHFWANEYGQAIDAQLSRVLTDLNVYLQCKDLKGSVISTTDHGVTVNLGRRHGMKKGDILTVYHLENITDNRGIIRQSTVLNTTPLIVDTLYDNHLIAIAQKGELYGDIHTGAIATLQQRQ